MQRRFIDLTRGAEIIPLRKYDAVIYTPEAGRVFCLQVLARVRKEPLPVCEVVDLRGHFKK